MKVVKLKEVVQYRKEFFEIDNDVLYKRCRVQLHRRGVVLRDEILGQDIKTKKQRLCKPNDFIVAEMDAKFGGYGIIPEELDGAIVSSHYYLYEIDLEKLDLAFLDAIIDAGIIQDQIKAVGSTNYSRVSAKEVLEYEIPCPPLDKQQEIAQLYATHKNTVHDLLAKFEHQADLLKKLRQRILQEAIEGKLTAKWRAENPDVEPASALLERIQAEKAQLVAEKKIRKQKELPPISEDEIPFELPQGWEWARVSDISINSLGKMLDAQKNKGEYKPYLRNLNVQWYEINTSDLKQMRFEEHETDKYSVIKGDIVICEGGYPGQAAIWTSDETIMFQKALHRVRFISKSFSSKLFVHLLWLWDANGEIKKYYTGAGIKHLTGRSLNKMCVPLPPLAEQKAIVAKVEKLLALCDQLESEVTKNQENAEKLMQAVLREAFSSTAR